MYYFLLYVEHSFSCMTALLEYVKPTSSLSTVLYIMLWHLNMGAIINLASGS